MKHLTSKQLERQADKLLTKSGRKTRRGKRKKRSHCPKWQRKVAEAKKLQAEEKLARRQLFEHISQAQRLMQNGD